MPLIATSAMQSALATNDSFLWGDLFTFSSARIGTQAYSGGTQALELPSGSIVDPSSIYYGNTGTWQVGPIITRSKVGRKVGVEAAKVELTIFAGPNDFFGGANGQYTWQQCVQFGLFDQSVVEIDRYLAGPNGWGDTTYGAIMWFYGQVGDIEYGRSQVKMQINSLLGTLNQQQVPRRTYMASCTHIFGDNMCLYNRNLNAVTLPAVVHNQAQIEFVGFTPNPIYLYVEGTVTGVTGLNAGLVNTVSNWGNGNAYLSSPFIYPIANGDQFQLLPGCDHTVATCQNVFNNLIHYGGFPYIPPPEIAV